MDQWIDNSLMTKINFVFKDENYLVIGRTHHMWDEPIKRLIDEESYISMIEYGLRLFAQKEVYVEDILVDDYDKKISELIETDAIVCHITMTNYSILTKDIPDDKMN